MGKHGGVSGRFLVSLEARFVSSSTLTSDVCSERNSFAQDPSPNSFGDLSIITVSEYMLTSFSSVLKLGDTIKPGFAFEQ
jgi:hypothetical protein